MGIRVKYVTLSPGDHCWLLFCFLFFVCDNIAKRIDFSFMKTNRFCFYENVWYCIQAEHSEIRGGVMSVKMKFMRF